MTPERGSEAAGAEPQVILFSHDLDSLRVSGRSSGTGVAQFIDENAGSPQVIHLRPLAEPPWGQEGRSAPFEWHLNHRGGGAPAANGQAPAAVVQIDTTASPVQASCTIRLAGDRTIDRPVQIVATGASSFTRNATILETDALAGSAVLCIGLGSGGSVVVDQLARAGVGRFILWDKDRLEAHNVGRHVCTLRDVGRRKVLAMRDHILTINPAARIDCIDEDVLSGTKPGGKLEHAIREANCIVVGTDNNASRYAVNDASWRLGKVALYGRAFTRASGGDVIQVIPAEPPCYACHLAGRVVDEEISSKRDFDRVAYADRPVPIEPGLNIDIHPVANMLARLCLLRLCEQIGSPLATLASEMTSPLYLWANRREHQFEKWRPMGRSYDRLAILRWYAVAVAPDSECPTCASSGTA